MHIKACHVNLCKIIMIQKSEIINCMNNLIYNVHGHDMINLRIFNLKIVSGNIIFFLAELTCP